MSDLGMAVDVSNSSEPLIIELEEDEVTWKKRGLFHSKKPRSGPKVRSEVNITPRDPVITEVEGTSGSYLSAEFATVQPLDNDKSLLILRIQCHPATGRRFGNATITWSFKPDDEPAPEPTLSPSSASAPRIILHAPQHSVGGWTDEHKRLLWGVSLPVQVGFGGSSVGVEPSREIEIQTTVTHAMTIRGTARSKGAHCVWTVEENQSSVMGIPSHFQLAVVLEHEGPFITELDVKATLNGGPWPRLLHPKKERDKDGLARRIDVDRWKNGEAKCGHAEAEWRKFVGEITGEVPGVVVAFPRRSLGLE